MADFRLMLCKTDDEKTLYSLLSRLEKISTTEIGKQLLVTRYSLTEKLHFQASDTGSVLSSTTLVGSSRTFAVSFRFEPFPNDPSSKKDGTLLKCF